MRQIESRNRTILLGAHFSVAGGLQNAVLSAAKYGCPVLQVFTKNANTWKERDLSPDETQQFLYAKKKHKIFSVSSHTAYLLNLASPDHSKRERSVKALEKELVRSSQLGISYVIMHPGAHMDEGEDRGLRRIARGIDRVFRRVPDVGCKLLLEATAGQGSSLGHTFEQLARIRDLAEAGGKVGFCLDTCHIFAAGYDIRTEKGYQETMDALDRVIGLDHLNVMHLNDAKKGLGSRVDRHEHIGEGAIGMEAFRFIMNDPRLKRIPKIIETPKDKNGVDYDRVNLKRLRSLVTD